MRLKTKPTKPKRMTGYHIQYRIDEYYNNDLAEMIDWFKNEGVPESEFSKVYFSQENGYYDDPGEFYFTYLMEMEPEDQYAARLEQYKKRLEEYNKWYKENKKEVEEELQKRREKENKKAEKQKKLTKKKIAELQKELAKLEGK